MPTKLPILVYHRVHRPDEVTIPNDARRVDVPEFTRQMDYLSEAGFQTVTYPQIAAWLYDGVELPDRSVAIDFDDNRLAVLENVFPILSERGFNATVFVITDLADGKDVFGQAGRKDFPSMNWDHLRQLYEAGWCMAAHTRQHLWLAGPDRMPKDDDEARDELTGSKERIEREFGEEVPYFAYCNGSWNSKVENMVKEVFTIARHWGKLSDYAHPLVTAETNPHRLPGIDISPAVDFKTFRQIIDSAM